jgi:eukaryotic-like serine/threonine-protein kinase
MSTNLPFERRLATWMADEAASGVPVGAIDEAISVTSRMRPRPRWLALLRESPMRTNSLVVVGSPTRRLAFALAALALTAVALVAGALLLTRPAAADDWPTFRGAADRSGVGLHGPVGRPAAKWQVHLDGVPASLVIVGDTAFVSTDAGTLYALDTTTGNERWTFKSTNLGPMTGPTVNDGLVYVTDGAGAVVAIDAKSGVQRWTAPTQLVSASMTLAANQTVYVGGDGGQLIALDAKTGATRWRQTLPGAVTVHNQAYADGTVYAGLENGSVFAVNAETGDVAWAANVGSNVGTIVVADGILYAGVGGNAATNLTAFDSRSGARLWQSGAGYQSPAVQGGVAYLGSTTGIVAALRTSDGGEVWRLQLPGTTVPAALADGVVYIAAGDPGHVYALDARTGGLRWSLDMDAPAACCVVPSHGLAFAASQNGTVYAFVGDGASLTPAPLADLASSQPSLVTQTSEPSTGPPSTAPSEPQVAIVKAAGTLTTTDPSWKPLELSVDPSGRLWSSDAFNNRFSVFDKNGKFLEFFGKEGSGPGEFKMQRSNGDSYGSVAFASNGTMFALDIGNRRVQVFDQTGKFLEQWGEFGFNRGQLSEPVKLVIGPEDTIYILDDVRGVIVHFDRHGKALGEFNAFPNATSGANSANSMAIDPAGNLYVSQINPGQVTRFDLSGKVTGVFGLPGVAPGQYPEQPGSIAIDASGRVFVTQGPDRRGHPGVYVFDADAKYLGGFGTQDPGDLHIGWPSGILLLAGDVYVSDVGVPPGTDAVIHRYTLLPPFAP